MTAADVPQMVDVHLEVFDGYFMTLMGRRFVSLYYGQYLDHPHSYAVVAEDAGRVVGFIVGTCDLAGLERRFYRRHFLTLGTIIVTRSILSRAARAGVTERTKLIRRAMASVLKASSKNRQTAARKRPAHEQRGDRTADIVSIAVTRSFRGAGVGKLLLESFQQAARRDGVTMVVGTVKRENEAHVARKTRAGWIVLHADDRSILYAQRLTAPQAEPDAAPRVPPDESA